MKKIKLTIIILITILITSSCMINVYATTSKSSSSSKNNTITNKTNNVVNTVNNTENALTDTSVSAQSEIDSLVESLSENGLTKSNLSAAISKYKELSKTYTNDEIADMLDKSTSDISGNNINTENIDNINKVLRNFNAEQLNDILNQVDIDEALNELSSGSTLLDVVKEVTQDMTPQDKANLAWSILWSGRVFHIIIIIIIVFELYKIFLRCVIYKKAKKHAWAILIPIYRDIVMLKICGMSPWWLLLIFVPIIGWAILWIVSVASRFMLAEAFGKGEGFGLGLWLLWPIFESILAFSKKTKYVGIEK